MTHRHSILLNSKNLKFQILTSQIKRHETPSEYMLKLSHNTSFSLVLKSSKFQ